MKVLHLVLGPLALACTLVAPSVASAGPPPFADPSAMSGIPRPDPKLQPGVVTVRCLGKAGFSAPAVGIEVTLTVAASDGTSKTFTAKTQEQGRATFEDLGQFTGANAVASATLGGAAVSSLPIKLLPQAGTAVMLVEGASAPAASGSTGAAVAPTNPGEARNNGPEIPAPGNAFPLKGTPAGTLTVGTFDLAARKPLGDIEVTLTITPPADPGGEPIVRTGKSDARGKFVFDALAELAPGSMLVVEATLVEGGEKRTSQPFEMDGEVGMALVLAEGAEHFVPPERDDAQAQAQAGPAELPGPRILRTLTPGNVRVTLVDLRDAALAGQNVLVVKKTAAGGVEKFRGTTGANGSVLVENVPIQQDALYFVEVMYSGAPYQSRFFGMDPRGGVAVDMRLFETTSDRSVVRSALQYDIGELENDMAQVVQIYEVMVSGERAFWDPEFEIRGPESAKSFTVLRPAEDMLDHEEKAPFATLHGPIPPGTLTNLSVGYLLEHDGDVEVSWAAPFELIQSTVLVEDDLTLQAGGAEPTDLASPIPGKAVWKLPGVGQGGTVSLTMSGLRIRDPIYRRVGMIGGALTFGGVLLGFAMYRRQTRREQLVERKALFIERLGREDISAAERATTIHALDEAVRQLEALDRVGPPPGKEG